MCLCFHLSVKVEPREASLGPGDDMIATVTVLLDEARAFKDALHILVSDGADVPIPLEATGGFTHLA